MSLPKFEELAAAAIKAGKLSGLVALTCNRDRTFTSTTSLGRSTPSPSSQSMSPSTLFTLTSLTKLPTIIALLQLLSQGVISSLDQDVTNHLPESLTSQPVLKGFTSLEPPEDSDKKPAQTPILEPRTLPFTPLNLQVHTSGLAYPFLSPLIPTYLSLNSHSIPSLETLESRFLAPLLFQPGESWSYSPGVDFVGRLVETLTSSTLDSYFRENILNPLGIPHEELTFWPRDAASVTPILARDSSAASLVVSPGPGPSEKTKDCLGGQGLYGTPRAFFKLLSSLLDADSCPILPANVVPELFRPRLESRGSKDALRKEMADPAWIVGPFFPQSSPELVVVDYDWALPGLLTTSSNHPHRRKGTVCWGGMTNLYWFLDPETGLCGVFATSLLPPGDETVRELMANWESEVYEQAGIPKGSLSIHLS